MAVGSRSASGTPTLPPILAEQYEEALAVARQQVLRHLCRRGFAVRAADPDGKRHFVAVNFIKIVVFADEILRFFDQLVARREAGAWDLEAAFFWHEKVWRQ